MRREKRQLSVEELTAKLEEACVRGEQCSHDILRKLARRGVSGATAEKIVAHLREGRFVDDERFARAYVRDKYLFSRWGRRKIALGLYAKSMPRDLIDGALAEIDVKVYAKTAFKVLAGKLKMLDDDLPRMEKREKLFRFGVSRGYESALLIKIINSARLWSGEE